jgi:hypothetical protein
MEEVIFSNRPVWFEIFEIVLLHFNTHLFSHILKNPFHSTPNYEQIKADTLLIQEHIIKVSTSADRSRLYINFLVMR